jgi:hypothetical protein
LDRIFGAPNGERALNNKFGGKGCETSLLVVNLTDHKAFEGSFEGLQYLSIKNIHHLDL